jgi:hypothetical protein
MFGKVAQAVGVLITNHNDVRERVWVASRFLFQVQPGGLPASCREDVEWIHHILTRYPADSLYKNRLDATYYRTRKVTASKIAERVWKLYHVMESELRTRGQ